MEAFCCVIFLFVSPIYSLRATGLFHVYNILYESIKYLACPILLYYNLFREENACCEAANNTEKEKGIFQV